MSKRVAVPTVTDAARVLLEAFTDAGMTASTNGTGMIQVCAPNVADVMVSVRVETDSFLIGGGLSERKPKSISVTHDAVRKSHFPVTDGSIAPQKIIDKVSAVITDVVSLRAEAAKKRMAVAADDKVIKASLSGLKNKLKKPATVVASRVVKGEARHDLRINDLSTEALDKVLGALNAKKAR